MHIDSHVHFWKYDKVKYDWIDKTMKTLQQDYLPEHLSLPMKRNDIDGVVAVQANQSEYDTHFLVELAKTHPGVIKGVVGWIDLQADNIAERLQHFSQYPIIKGYRHVVQGEPLEFLSRPNFRRGIQALKPFNYTYDILIFHHQLQPAIDFVRAFPDQPFVIDHLAKPDIRRREINEWKANMQEIAKFPNVCCKLSGLFTEANWKEWSAADFYPYLDVVFDAFGVDRLLYGSDWPVMLLSGIYVQWKSLLEKYMENFEPEDKEKVFGENAIQFYNL
jgi:L-fuconolactonase